MERKISLPIQSPEIRTWVYFERSYSCILKAFLKSHSPMYWMGREGSQIYSRDTMYRTLRRQLAGKVMEKDLEDEENRTYFQQLGQKYPELKTAQPPEVFEKYIQSIEPLGLEHAEMLSRLFYTDILIVRMDGSPMYRFSQVHTRVPHEQGVILCYDSSTQQFYRAGIEELPRFYRVQFDSRDPVLRMLDSPSS